MLKPGTYDLKDIPGEFNPKLIIDRRDDGLFNVFIQRTINDIKNTRIAFSCREHELEREVRKAISMYRNECRKLQEWAKRQAFTNPDKT